MPELSAVPVLVGTAVAFGLGGAYYALFGDQLEASGEMGRWMVAVELLRCLVLTAVVSGLAVRGEVDTFAGGLLLGVALWVGFPFVLWVGAVIHENTPVRLAAIHAGDWLVKLLLVAVIAGAWQ